MRKPDEIAMMRTALRCWQPEATGNRFVKTPEWEAIVYAGYNRRVEFILSKWAGDVQGTGPREPGGKLKMHRYGGPVIWWDSGVTTRSGWLTPEGFEALSRIVAEHDARQEQAA